MNRTAYIFVPGVMNYPGSARAWTDRAVTWIHNKQALQVAEKFEYLAFPATRNVLANRRARELAALIDRYPIESFSLVLAGHSNGCELIRWALKLSKRPANFVHLFAPAIPAAPRSHRLKAMVRDGRIGFLRIYVGTRDAVLVRRFLGGRPSAYVRAQFADEHHTEIIERNYAHTTWFYGANFEESMRHIAGLAEDTP